MFKKIVLYISFIISLFSFTAYSEDDTCSNKVDKVLCMAKQGDTMAMYVMGRREYTIARTSGDMTKALEWTLKVMEDKERVAGRLLKMIYIQLGEGVHKDYIQAYIWLQEGINKGEKYIYLIPWQKRLKYYMSENELIEAENIISKMNTK
jgi:TPR repeat protein